MKAIIVNALWCTSCLFMRPRYTKHLQDFEIVEYDFDEDQDEIKKYNVGKVLPVLIIENKGKEVMRIIGEKSNKELKKLLGEINNV